MNLAPNGKPSNLNAEQYKLVRTPAFKKWFGDWENDPENASKVVDENGEPLVVYRGMPKKRRVGNVFKYNVNMFSKRGTERQKNDFAFYFTDLKIVAERYGEAYAEEINDDDNYVVKAYFLNIRNLFKAFSEKNQTRITFKKLYDLATKNQELFRRDYKGKIETDYKGNPKLLYDYRDFKWSYLKNDDEMFSKYSYEFFVDWDKHQSNQFFWSNLLQEYMNYDGLVFYEDTYNDKWIQKEQIRIPEFNNEFSKTYGVFKSNQIKLADGSNTTFDSSNDDIRYEQGGIVDTGKENFGKPLDCDDWTFIHETSQEDAKSILQNGFILSEKVITKGVYTIPESWKEAKLNRPNNQSIELSVLLKKGAKIFWTDSDRPTDYYYGYGNKFYIKLYKKLNKGEVSPYEAYIKMNDRELWHKRKAEFCRKMEKWLKENGYCGIQQGGEIVITDLQAIKSIDVYERSDNEHYKNGGLLGGWNYSIGGL